MTNEAWEDETDGLGDERAEVSEEDWGQGDATGDRADWSGRRSSLLDAEVVGAEVAVFGLVRLHQLPSFTQGHGVVLFLLSRLNDELASLRCSGFPVSIV